MAPMTARIASSIGVLLGHDHGHERGDPVPVPVFYLNLHGSTARPGQPRGPLGGDRPGPFTFPAAREPVAHLEVGGQLDSGDALAHDASAGRTRYSLSTRPRLALPTSVGEIQNRRRNSARPNRPGPLR